MEDTRERLKEYQEIDASLEDGVAEERLDASALSDDERQLASAMISVSSPLPFRLQ